MQNLALFFRLWIWFSFRQLIAHRWRTIVVLLGIGIGAAVFTSVRLAITASLDSFTKTVDTLAGKAQWSVTHPGGRVPEHLVTALLKQKGVKTASPVLTVYVHPAANDAEAFLVIGIDPILDRPLRTWQLEQSGSTASSWLDLLADPYTLLVSQRLSKNHQLVQGGSFSLEYAGRVQTFRILDVLASEGLALANAGNVAITDISTLQEFTGLYGMVDRIDLLLKPNAVDADVSAIRSMLPRGMVLSEPSETRESGRMMIKAYQLNLSVLSFVSLFVGMFLVYSLVALHSTSRRHELAVLRSIGASPRTLFLLFLAEGAFFGIVGWIVAIPLASFMVRRLLGSISSTISHLFARVEVDQLQLNFWELLLSFLITLLIAILAAYHPAREAMKVPPREAFLIHESGSGHKRSAHSLAFVGFLLILLVWPLTRLPGASGIPLSGYIATFLLFSGFSLLSPWFLRLMGTHLPPFLKNFGGQPAYLGGRYLRDAGSRVAVSVGALITAVALFVALVIMVFSFRSTVETWVHQSIRGDLFLQTKMANTNRYRDHLPSDLVEELRQMEPHIDLLPYRRILLNYGKSFYIFEAIDFEMFFRHGDFLLLEGRANDIMPKLVSGQGVVVSEVFANQTGLRVGKHYKANIEGISLDLPVLGVFRDYRTQGGVVHYSLDRFEQLTGERVWTGVRIFFNKSGSQPHAGNALAGSAIQARVLKLLTDWNSIETASGTDLRQAILKIFDETFAITTVLLLIALFVAALGITTTLTVLVLERTPQLNTLLAIGAGFSQIRAMIVWEAVLMVTAGQLIGTACGFVLSYLLIFVINRQSFGWTFVYGVDWISLLASWPLILATALLAALPAGQLVFKGPPASILRER